MTYRTTKPEQWAEALGRGEDALDALWTESAVANADTVEHLAILLLQDALRTLGSGYPTRITKTGTESRRWESEASMIVHEHLKDVPLEVQADAGFWSGLALGPLRPFVLWRYDSDLVGVSRLNFGIGNPAENLIFRLWKRGEIGFEPGAIDPYSLTRFGTIDVWRSHIFRQTYAHATEVSREIIRVQASDQPLKKLQIRWLAKELRRLRANIVFEFLTASQASAMVQAAAQRARETIPAAE